MSRALNIPCYSTSLQPNVVPRSDFPQFLLPGSFGRWGNRLSYRLFNWLTLLGQNQSFGAWAKTHLSKTHLSKTALPKNFDARLTRLSSFYPDAKEIPILQGFSRCIVPQPEEWSEEVAPTTGYWFRPLPKGALPPELEKFLQEGPPPIYVGFGSMPVARAESIAEEVISALRKLGRRGVLSIGWGGLRGALPSEDIFVLDSAPHELLFPRCCLVVHHGGAGTTHEGLRWGRPTVICPAGVDQPFWARRLMAIGVSAEALPLKRLNADALASRINSALSPEIVERAEIIGEQIRKENGAERAAEIIFSTWK